MDITTTVSTSKEVLKKILIGILQILITVVLCLIAAGNSELHLYSPESLTWAGCTEESFQELNRTVFTGAHESRDLKYVNNVKLLLSKYTFIQITQMYNQYIHKISKTSVNER